MSILKKKIHMKKESTGKKFGFSLFFVIAMLAVIPLIVSIVIVSMLSFQVTKNNLEEAAKEKLSIVASNLASHCKENEIDAISVTAYYDYLDSLKDQNIEMAIILDGSPCNTSIKNENDYRIREINFAIDILAEKENITEGYYEENVIIEGQSYYAYCLPIEVKGEITGVAFAGELQKNVTGRIDSIITIFLTIAVVLIIFFSGIALLFSKVLLRNFKTVRKNMTVLSEGNLGKQAVRKSLIKEMNDLMNATGHLQENLSSTIGQVKEVAGLLVGDVLEVTDLSHSTAEHARLITTSMEDLSAAITSLAGNVLDISNQMSEFDNGLNEISGNVEHLYGNSENILRTNLEAKADMDDIMDNSVKSVEAVDDITKQIEQTNSSIAEIDQAVELILDITEQTNLLSLNASIEAARAGVHGRGFAVVAEEIRHLSEQSAKGAEMIKNLAGTITQKSNQSVNLAENVHGLIASQQEGILKTQKKYEVLSTDINHSVSEIRAIAEKTEAMMKYKEKVVDNVQDLSAISEETAAGTQEVGTNVGEIIAEVQRVNENCQKMNDMAGELQVAVSYFKE